jgi:hypothetical protein
MPENKSGAKLSAPPRIEQEDIKQSLDHDAIKKNRIMILSLYLSMIFSENRFPLFRIMLLG